MKLKNGRIRNAGVLHTPDFFVIQEKILEQGERTIELGWEEWKTEEALREFERAESNRYM